MIAQRPRKDYQHRRPLRGLRGRFTRSFAPHRLQRQLKVRDQFFYEDLAWQVLGCTTFRLNAIAPGAGFPTPYMSGKVIDRNNDCCWQAYPRAALAAPG